ncbi:MAG: amino acid--tRNA ligase-related protein [Candidatus Shapirobacteria bacterium]
MTPLETRQQLLKLLRHYFWDQSFVEVDCPILYPSLPLEPNIYSLSTKWCYQQRNLFLATSPETTLKQVLATQKVNCFSLGKSFRDLEASGPTHQPEFTMLEWYEIGIDYLTLTSSVENLIIALAKNFASYPTLNYQSTHFDLTPPWPKVTLTDLFLKYAHSPLPASEPDLNQMFLNLIEPNLPQNTPLFITDFPSFMSPLAAPQLQNPALSQRFELYFGSMELANGCSENTSTSLITNSFNAEAQNRQKLKLPTHPPNFDFAKTSSLLPPSAGVGLGFDRLLMLLTNSDSIDQVVYQPL